MSRRLPSESLDGVDVEALAAEWLAFKESELGAATLYTYRRVVASLVLPALPGRDLSSVTAADLQWILMKALKERSANEALKTRAVLRGMFGHAQRLGLTAGDPSSAIRLPRGTGTHRGSIRSVPTPGDAVAVGAQLDPRYRLMPLLAAFAGLRWQEVAALRPGDFDVDRRVVTVERALGRMDGLKEPKSKAGHRKTVWGRQITPDVVRHLDAWADSDWVFTSARGSLLHYPNWRRRHWLGACERAGLTWTFHEYRHTFAVESLRRGRSVQSVAAMMGHANPRVTWEFYAGLFDDHLDEARKAW